jgi:hypothetical protein
MSRSHVERVADAVLYEGYLLYPYRPSSVKNRQRWTFGGVYPRAYAESQSGADAWEARTECLLVAPPGATVTIRVRFLHLLQRQPGELTPPLTAWPASGEPSFRPVPLLRIGDRSYPAWQEATERESGIDGVSPARLTERPVVLPLHLAAGRELQPLAGPDGTLIGVLNRVHERIDAEIEFMAQRLEPDLFRLTVSVRNQTRLDEAASDREPALPHTLISTHVILHVAGGAFVSLLDPPPRWREHAGACRNVGLWPVLVGDEGGDDTVLASPIILYDHPEVAAESPGDLFDATEIDEILTLRILTLTDNEKQEIIAADERARALLERTESLANDQLLGLHGTMREIRPRRAGDV